LQNLECKLQVETDSGTACRLIIDPPASGAWNMAVDELLLATAADEGIATLRFYQWSVPTLSLGYFQRGDDRGRHAASLGCPLVRRQTGGGAIVHDRELTYSLTLPAGHPLAAQADRLYRAVHAAFIAVLRPLIADGETRCTLQIHEADSPLRPEEEPFLCFQRRAKADVLLTVPGGADWNRQEKILGSAQRRRRGAISQHGSLLLETSRLAAELPGIYNLTGVRVSAGDVAAGLRRHLSELLEMSMVESRLPDESDLAIEKLVDEKYDSTVWNGRR